MSYDRKISLKPAYLHAYGVSPTFHDIKSKLPAGNKEPEPKILLKNPNAFNKIRALFCLSENAFMIPEQIWAQKHPLVSLLLDTKENQIPTAEFTEGNHSLRYRYEIDPETGLITQRDFNEKSSMKLANIIGGCADRDEREIEVPLEQTLKDGYQALKDKYRALNDTAYCDDIPYENLHVFGGYIAARTEYGFAVKHPRHNVMMVFEACEDIFEVYGADMSHAKSHLYEFEFEPREVWGDLPAHAQTPEGFREFLYSAMNDIRNHLCAVVRGAEINPNTKADYVKDMLIEEYGMEYLETPTYLTAQFQSFSTPRNYLLTSERLSLNAGMTLEETLSECQDSIFSNAERLHNEKKRLNEDMIQPSEDYIASGAQLIDFEPYRLAANPKVVARLG